MLEYIYICRHGFRSNWVDPSIKSGPTGMNRDPPLAVHGLNQSKHLASFLSNPEATQPYPTPELVFSSPFYRCIQTAVPTAQALGLTLEEGEPTHTKDGKRLRKGINLEHGVQEWYSPVYPNTGLHPRPGKPASLIPLFPPGVINPSYSSTVYPSRKGESLEGLHRRAEDFVDSWVSRVEGEWPDVKCVVIFAHAASLIALGRALTGDRSLDIVAGCATTALYKRKPPPTTTATDSPVSSSSSPVLPHCGTAQWTLLYSGRSDYLPSGLERDWSFADIVLKPDGEVVSDNGDGDAHEGEDWEEGIAEGMDRWLRPGKIETKGNIGVGDRSGLESSRL